MPFRDGVSAVVLSFGGLLMIGCGYQTPATVCTVGSLASTQIGSPKFTVVPSDTSFTIYPGQTKTLTVAVQPVGSASGSVTLRGVRLPQGLTVSGATVPIGGTANLTVTAGISPVPNCFNANFGVFSADVPLTIAADGTSGSIQTPVATTVVLEDPVFVPAASDLPIMTITTNGAASIDSEDDYVEGSVTIKDAAVPAFNYTGSTQIKGHGNSTWAMPKKPYRLKLDSKAPLFGMSSSTNWILLANYDDKSMLRNDIAFEMSRRFGMFWTPSSQFVELYVNGTYEGTYQLAEKVEVGKARLNIGSMDDTDNSGTNLTGGYLGEIDNYAGETFTFRSLVKLPIGLDDPDPPTPEQSAYFASALTTAENSLFTANLNDSASGWQAYWDEDSLVQWFLVEELSGNHDANDWSSDYFYKPRGDARFYRGPVWDTDISMGNDNYGAIQNPSVPWVSTQSKWYLELMDSAEFRRAVKAKWKAVRPQVATLPDYVDARATMLKQAAENNYSRWPTLGETVWPNPEAAGSYQGEITYLKSWLNYRIAYMDAHYLE